MRRPAGGGARSRWARTALEARDKSICLRHDSKYAALVSCGVYKGKKNKALVAIDPGTRGQRRAGACASDAAGCSKPRNLPTTPRATLHMAGKCAQMHFSVSAQSPAHRFFFATGDFGPAFRACAFGRAGRAFWVRGMLSCSKPTGQRGASRTTIDELRPR